MTRSWKISRFSIITLTLCAVGMVGCTSVKSGIDPSGEHVFTPPAAPSTAGTAADAANTRYFDDPLNRLPYDDIAVLVEPRETVVPVGSEVILIAGVAGQDGYLRTNRRLEWTVAPGSVGHFVAVQKNGMCDMMLGDFNMPRIVNSTFAIGSTSRENIRLNRGTPSTDDDKMVMRGQGWITLTSPIEGTSHVNVVAPEVYGWDARTKTATVHFVDAVVQYPPPAINPANTRHTFTTTVLHYSNQSPCENWIVRYEIVDGPRAGFSADGSAVAEVRTNAAGQASVEIHQLQPAPGVNKVNIQVIRPAEAAGAGGQRLVVGNGSTTKTWSAADLAVQVTGPATASVGSPVNCRIEVSNPGDLPAKDVTATVNVPEGLSYVNSKPAAEAAGRQLRWRFGELGARQRQTIEVSFRADKQGSAVTCCDATAAGSLNVRNCVTTTIGLTATPPTGAAPSTTSGARLEVSLAPSQSNAKVGEKVPFTIAFINRSQAEMTKLNIRVHLDPGLSSPLANDKGSFARDLSLLAAGEKQEYDLPVDVTKPGRWSVTVEVVASSIAPVTAQAWVNAVAPDGAAAATPPITPPTTVPSAPPIAVTVTGSPKSLTERKMAEFVIEVRNTGTTPLQNVKVVDRCDSTLDTVYATKGWVIDKDAGALVWNIDALPPSQESTRFRLQCNCESATPRAYHRVSVIMPDGGHVDAEGYVEIVKAGNAGPPAGFAPPTGSAATDLSVSAAGLTSPVQPGKELTYEIRVTNKSATAPYRQIRIAAALPEGITPIAEGSTVKKIEGQLISVDDALELEPGKSMTYRIRAQAKRVGNYRLHAELTLPGLQKPLAADADETEVRE